jgi:hypothetical protein
MVLPVPVFARASLHKLRIRACDTNLSRDMKGDGGEGWKATAYTSFPSKMVSNVAACTSVQRSKGRSFSSRSAESLPRATKSAKRTFERAVFWVDEGIISGLFVGLDGPSTGEEGVTGAVRALAAIAAPRRKNERPRPRPRPLPRPRGLGGWFAFLIEIMYSGGQMMQRRGGFGKWNA